MAGVTGEIGTAVTGEIGAAVTGVGGLAAGGPPWPAFVLGPFPPARAVAFVAWRVPRRTGGPTVTGGRLGDPTANLDVPGAFGWCRWSGAVG
ncbi:MAG TPA: hypothetical protein VND44_10410, partial [Acidimicrobiales bacterium]|nr:hypothetical protein [Acidimicrobiales bacterium]